jgi:hypothetical protein
MVRYRRVELQKYIQIIKESVVVFENLQKYVVKSRIIYIYFITLRYCGREKKFLRSFLHYWP